MMARVLVTGSTVGLGHATAAALLDAGHHVIVHARNVDRLSDLRHLVDRGADVVVGELSDLDQTRELADQVNELGRMDAVVHNAGVISGPAVLPVNVVAPYLLTALIDRPDRLVYLSSSMHRGGRCDLAGADWTGHRQSHSYSDSKLWVTTLAATVARLWPEVHVHAVDPGWVPTRMGGPAAPDDLQAGHQTQTWLATSTDPDATTTDGYWHHHRRRDPHPAVHDRPFQDQLLDELAQRTGTDLT